MVDVPTAARNRSGGKEGRQGAPVSVRHPALRGPGRAEVSWAPASKYPAAAWIDDRVRTITPTSARVDQAKQFPGHGLLQSPKTGIIAFRSSVKGWARPSSSSCTCQWRDPQGTDPIGPSHARAPASATDHPPPESTPCSSHLYCRRADLHPRCTHAYPQRFGVRVFLSRNRCNSIQSLHDRDEDLLPRGGPFGVARLRV